jgi:hypothetical protein
MRRAGVLAVASLAVAVAVAEPAPAAAAAPVVEQMVVARSGAADVARVRAGATTVRVGRRRCAVAAATPLAALWRARPARVALRDYGSCSRRARDAGGLYVAAIGSDRARGRGGWVYKVGNRLATAGAADPSGPFGRGRLRGRPRVAWFYCVLDERNACQPTLAIRVRVEGGEAVARMLAYDDEGRARPAGGATLRSGARAATADANGLARLALPAGRHRLHAEAAGAIRSFPHEVTIG